MDICAIVVPQLLIISLLCFHRSEVFKPICPFHIGQGLDDNGRVHMYLVEDLLSCGLIYSDDKIIAVHSSQRSGEANCLPSAGVTDRHSCRVSVTHSRSRSRTVGVRLRMQLQFSVATGFGTRRLNKSDLINMSTLLLVTM